VARSEGGCSPVRDLLVVSCDGRPMAANPDFINCKIGDRVFDAADPRHIGRIDRVDYGACMVDIFWLETGWRSLGVPAHTLRRAAYVRRPNIWRAIEPKED
jgi:hypothetical protein